jgi:8-oxo-dGTP diphosphatase
MEQIHSVAVLIYDGVGTYLLQHRDERSDIVYPGKIGLFGGKIEDGESPEQGAVREIREELCIDISNLKLISILNLTIMEPSVTRTRYFYVSVVAKDLVEKINLQEGQAVMRMGEEDFLECQKFVPYDLAFVLSYISDSTIDN